MDTNLQYAIYLIAIIICIAMFAKPTWPSKNEEGEDSTPTDEDLEYALRALQQIEE